MGYLRFCGLTDDPSPGLVWKIYAVQDEDKKYWNCYNQVFSPGYCFEMEKDKEGELCYYEVGLYKCMFWYCNDLNFKLVDQAKEFIELLEKEAEKQEEDLFNVANRFRAV